MRRIVPVLLVIVGLIHLLPLSGLLGADHLARLYGIALEDLGFEVRPSQANFLFARHPAHDAAALAARLRAHKVLVRHFAQPRIEQYLRISIGTPAQCERLLQALAAIL